MKYLVVRTWKTAEHADAFNWFSCPLTVEVCAGVLNQVERAADVLTGVNAACEVSFYGCPGEFHEAALPLDDHTTELLENGEVAIVDVDDHWPEGARIECPRLVVHRTGVNGQPTIGVYWTAYPKHVTELYESVSVPVSIFEEMLQAQYRVSSDRFPWHKGANPQPQPYRYP